MKKKISKSKKVANMKNKNKTVTNSENPESIQKLIFEDVKNINKFNILIEEFILNLENRDFKNLEKYFKAIFEILQYFLIKNTKNISNDLISFLEDKIHMISNILVDSLDIDEIAESNLKILKYLLEFLNFSKKEKLDQIFLKLSEIFILNEELVEPSQIQMFSQLFTKSKNFFDSFFLIFNENFNNKIHDINSTSSEEILFNIFNFLITIPKLPNNKPELKFYYQNILIKLINHNKLPEILLRNILLNLNKIIFDNLENPLIMSDYLVNIYEKSSAQEYDLKVLSLSGLFVLITKYKLDYSNYYNILYKTISMKDFSEDYVKTVFDSRYRNRIYKIIELSLKSSTVPMIVILSFIKKLARICLMTTSNNITIILGIIQNLIKSHPRSVILLHRVNLKANSKANKENVNDNIEVDVNKAKKIKENSKFNWEKFQNPSREISNGDEGRNEKNEEDLLNQKKRVEASANYESSQFAKYEQFDDDQTDPYKTKAHISCLWEFASLKFHYSFKIRNLVGKFERNFLKLKEFDMNSVSNLKEEDMFYEVNEGSTFYVTPLNTISQDKNEEELQYRHLNKKILNII